MRRAATIALVAAVRHRVELRRRRDHPQLGLAVFLGAAVGTLFVVGSLPIPYYEAFWPEPGAFHYGTLVADEPDRVLVRAREIAAIALVVIAGLAGLSATTSEDWDSPPVELLTAVPLPTAILGVLGDELLESSWFVVPVAVAGSLAFAAGTGQPVVLVGVLFGSLVIVATGLVIGTAIGIGTRAAIRGSPRLYRSRNAVGFVALFVTFVGLVASRTAGGALARTPLGWYGDLLLVTTAGVDATLAYGVVATVGSGVSLAAALAVVVVSARVLWFAEVDHDHDHSHEHERDDRSHTPTTETNGVDTESTASTATDSSVQSPLETTLGHVLSRPTMAVTRATWRRIRRSPNALVFVVLPFAIVGPATANVAIQWPQLVPVLVTLYAAAAVGLGTTLNPIGNERIALPAILTTPTGRRSVLRGHAVAALVPGVPTAVTVAIVAGSVTGYSVGQLAALVVVAVALTVGGVGVSLGIGSFLPNLKGPTAASLSPPELYAMVGYLFAMSLLSTPAFAGFAAIGSGNANPSELPTLPIYGPAFAVVVTVLLAGSVGFAGYRYAARTLDRYEAGGE
ncbi:hypothetical protein OB955_12965 [Halobacteria archaeon AArc-m2/3/4]|uniref:ABC-2 type transport system permease protein n=1 Tax=Natronoglomus mannanivorans TaxID=2979990 RepID=A0ABT2QFD5_9EURY|nr:hypothetical protein [Halobacteria archaeon AArc-m2/3/4]